MLIVWVVFIQMFSPCTYQTSVCEWIEERKKKSALQANVKSKKTTLPLDYVTSVICHMSIWGQNHLGLYHHRFHHALIDVKRESRLGLREISNDYTWAMFPFVENTFYNYLTRPKAIQKHLFMDVYSHRADSSSICSTQYVHPTVTWSMIQGQDFDANCSPIRLEVNNDSIKGA